MSSPEDAILDIVRVSERRNASLGCSGLLIYGDAVYCQMIEGALAALEELFASIRADPRHRMLRQEIDGPHRRRIWANLPMGYFDRSECLRAGLRMPETTMALPDVTETILRAAAHKYPGAMI